MTNTKLNKETTTILLGTLFTRMAMFMSTPFLAIYLTNELHFSPLQTGYVIGINPLVNVCFSFICGYISDKLAVKHILTWTPIFWGIIFISFNYSHSFYMFLFLNAINGLCYSLFEPTAKKTLSFYTNESKRLLVYNLRYAAINLGGVVGPLLSLVFNVKKSLISYLLLGVIYILFGLTNRIIFNGKQKNEQQTVTVLSRKKVNLKQLTPYLLLMLGITFSYFAYAQFNSTIAQFFANSPIFSNGVKTYSLIISTNAALIVLLQYFVLKMTKKISSFTVLIFSNLLLAFSLLMMIYSYHLSMIIVMVVFYSLGELLLGARFDFLVDQLAPKENKGFYFGLAELTKFGNTMGPIVGSFLLGIYGYTNSFQLFSKLAFITIIGTLFIFLSKLMYARFDLTIKK